MVTTLKGTSFSDGCIFTYIRSHWFTVSLPVCMLVLYDVCQNVFRFRFFGITS
jgi:hypothetical protein